MPETNNSNSGVQKKWMNKFAMQFEPVTVTNLDASFSYQSSLSAFT